MEGRALWDGLLESWVKGHSREFASILQKQILLRALFHELVLGGQAFSKLSAEPRCCLLFQLPAMLYTSIVRGQKISELILSKLKL